MKKHESLALLNLSTNEQCVLRLLSKHSTSIADLCKASALPRTTVVRTLTELHHRGLARRVTIGKRTHWKQAPLSSIQKRLSILKEVFSENQEITAHNKSLYINETASVNVMEGIEKLMSVYEHTYAQQGAKRVFLTQFASAMRTQIKSANGREYMARANHVANTTHGIAELFASSDTTHIWNRMSRNNALADPISQRLIDTSIVPDVFAPSDLPAELFVYDNMAMLTDWSTETGIIIKNPHIARMLKLLFRATKEHGKHFNPNKIFSEKLSST